MPMIKSKSLKKRRSGQKGQKSFGIRRQSRQKYFGIGRSTKKKNLIKRFKQSRRKSFGIRRVSLQKRKVSHKDIKSIKSLNENELEDVLYLVHITKTNPIEWTEKKLKSAIFDTRDQFPGVFLSIVTKQNVDNVHLYPGGNYKLYFSKNLLKQNNFHINMGDFQGYIGQNMTYYPWQLSTALESINKISEQKTQKDKDFSETFKIFGNNAVELVFHDDVLFDYLLKVEFIDRFDENSDEKLIIGDPVTIYTNPLAIDFKPDLTKLPFFVYPFERNYGSAAQYEGKIPKSDLSFFRAMARLANLLIAYTDTIDMIVDRLENNLSETIYKNRSLQNFDTFIGSYHSSLLNV